MKKATIEIARQSIEKFCSTYRNNPEIYLEKMIRKTLKSSFSFHELQTFSQNPNFYFPLTLLPSSTSEELQSNYIAILRQWGFDSQFKKIPPDWLRLEFKLAQPYTADLPFENKATQLLQEALQFSEIALQNNLWLVNQFWKDVEQKIEHEDYIIDMENETMIITFHGNYYQSCVFESSRFQLLQALAIEAGFSKCWCNSNMHTLHLKV